jgi:DNA-directed RNA polymerase specialized sigma24 family protein
MDGRQSDPHPDSCFRLAFIGSDGSPNPCGPKFPDQTSARRAAPQINQQRQTERNQVLTHLAKIGIKSRGRFSRRRLIWVSPLESAAEISSESESQLSAIATPAPAGVSVSESEPIGAGETAPAAAAEATEAEPPPAEPLTQVPDQFLSRLPSRCRRVYVLRGRECLDWPEIARRMGIDQQKARTYLERVLHLWQQHGEQSTGA